MGTYEDKLKPRSDFYYFQPWRYGCPARDDGTLRLEPRALDLDRGEAKGVLVGARRAVGPGVASPRTSRCVSCLCARCPAPTFRALKTQPLLHLHLPDVT